MKARRYFQLSFLLPILLPLLTTAFVEPRFSGWGHVALVLGASLAIGGVPYGTLLIALCVWRRGRDYKAIRRMTLVAPLLFVPVFLYCAAALIPLQIFLTGEVRVEIRTVVTFCVFILVLGYFYVLLANAGFLTLRALGHIAEESDEGHAAPGRRVSLGGKKYALAFALALPLLLIPVSTAMMERERRNFPKRIADADRIEAAANRDSALIEIAYEQAAAGRYEDARATVASHVGDKRMGFAGIVTKQVYLGDYGEARATAELIEDPMSRTMAYRQIAVAQGESSIVRTKRRGRVSPRPARTRSRRAVRAAARSPA